MMRPLWGGALMSALSLAGCGGGTEGSSDLLVTFDYPQTTEVQLFTPVSVTPTLDGLQGNRPTITVHETFTGSGLPQGWSYDARTGAVTGIATQPGQYSLGANLTVSGVEGNLTSSFVINVVTDIRISYPGSAPTLGPGSALPARSPALVAVQPGDTLAFAPIPGQEPPAGITINPTTGVISGTVPVTPSPYTYFVPVQMTVTRGAYSATINAVPGYVFAVR